MFRFSRNYKNRNIPQGLKDKLIENEVINNGTVNDIIDDPEVTRNLTESTIEIFTYLDKLNLVLVAI